MKRNNNYRFNIGNLVNGYTVLEKIRKTRIKNGVDFNEKAYKVKCNKCGYINEVLEDSLRNGRKCPICCSRKVE